jgi:hypothetical protein
MVQDKKIFGVLLLVVGAMVGAVLAFPAPRAESETQAAIQIAETPAIVPVDPASLPGEPPQTWHLETDQLWNRIVQRDFSDRSEVASGRFLSNFDERALLLEEIDLADARGIVRTPNWLRATVPLERGSTTEWVRVRFVLEDGAWKLEDLRETRAPKR